MKKMKTLMMILLQKIQFLLNALIKNIMELKKKIFSIF